MEFVIAAYAALWIGVFAYLLRLGGRVARLRADARSLAEGGPTGGTAPAGTTSAPGGVSPTTPLEASHPLEPTPRS